MKLTQWKCLNLSTTIKMSNIVKILCTNLMPFISTHRGEVTACLFVLQYKFYITALTPKYYILKVCLERVLLLVASFFVIQILISTTKH